MSGYYFTVSHSVRWWDLLDHLAAAMHARGLVDEPTTEVWPSNAFAAEALGVPVDFAHSIWNSRYVSPSVFPSSTPTRDVRGFCILNLIRRGYSPKVICVNKDLIGWKPVWNRELLLQNIDEEIDDFIELGMPKSSLLDSLRPQARQ